MYIIGGYLSLSTGLSLLTCNYETENKTMRSASASLLLLIVFLTFFKANVRFSLVSGFLFALAGNILLWGGNFITIILLELCKLHMGRIIRYALYYEAVLKSLNTTEDAVHKLPYYAMVSNFAYIIDTKMYMIIEYIPYRLQISMGTFILSGVLGYFGIPRRIVERNILFNDTIKTKRSVTQGVMIASCTMCSEGLAVVVKKYAKNMYVEYDVMMWLSSCVLLLMNGCLMKHTSYKVYSAVCPTMFLVMSGIVAFSSMFDNLILNSLYVLIIGLQLILYDPIRYTLYVLHHTHVISLYQSVDALFVGVVLSVIPYLSVGILPVICFMSSCIWIAVTTYSNKYNIKDNKCERCISLVQV